MTAEEAKKRWCPFATVYAGERGAAGNFLGSAGVSRDGRDATTRCVGAACMAWREIDTPGVVPEQGYCGLAGKP